MWFPPCRRPQVRGCLDGGMDGCMRRRDDGHVVNGSGITSCLCMRSTILGCHRLLLWPKLPAGCIQDKVFCAARMTAGHRLFSEHVASGAKKFQRCSDGMLSAIVGMLPSKLIEMGGHHFMKYVCIYLYIYITHDVSLVVTRWLPDKQ